MEKFWTVDCFSNLALRIDRYRTKEEPFQTDSKVVKLCESKFHCVASVLLVLTLLGRVWQDFIYECSMSLVPGKKLKFCDDLFYELLWSAVS